MSKGSKTSTSSATSKYTPPDYLGTAVQNSIADATDLYNQGAPSYYSGQTYADLNDYQKQSLDQTAQLAQNGSPLVRGAQGAVQGILDTPSGQNPFLDQYLARLASTTNATVNNSFNASGRLGSGANVGTGATAITNAQLPFLFNQFNTDNANKLSAAQIAPNLANYDFSNLARLGTVGDAYQAQTQKGIDENVARYNYDTAAPENFLNNYLNQLQSSPANQYGTSTQTQTTTQPKSSALGNILGTALSLGSLFVPGAQGLGLSGLTGALGLGSGIGSALGGIATAGNLFNSVSQMGGGSVGGQSFSPFSNGSGGITWN